MIALCGWLGYTTYREWTSGLTLSSVDEEVQGYTENKYASLALYAYMGAHHVPAFEALCELIINI